MVYQLIQSTFKKKKKAVILPHLVENEIIRILMNDRWLLPFRWRISLSLVCWRWFKQVSIQLQHMSIVGTRRHYRSLLNHINQPTCLIRSHNITSVHFNDDGIELGEFGGYLPCLLNDQDYDSSEEELELDVFGVLVGGDHFNDDYQQHQQHQFQHQLTVSEKRSKRLAKHPLRYVHERHAQLLRALYFPHDHLVSLELVWTNSGLLAPLLKGLSFPALKHFKFTYNKYPPLHNFNPCELLSNSPYLESLHLHLLSFDHLAELSTIVKKQINIFRKLSIVTHQPNANHSSHQICWNLIDILNNNNNHHPNNQQSPVYIHNNNQQLMIPIKSSIAPQLTLITYFKLSVLPTRDHNIPTLFQLLSRMPNLKTLLLQIFDLNVYQHTNKFNGDLLRYLVLCDQEHRQLRRLSSSLDIDSNHMLSALKSSTTLQRISINFSKYSLPNQCLRLNHSFKPQLYRLDLFKLPQHELLVYDLLNSNPHLRCFTVRNCNTMTDTMAQVIHKHIARPDTQLAYFKLKSVPYMKWSLVQMHKSLKTSKSIREVKIQIFFPHSTPTLQMRQELFKPADLFTKKQLPNIDILIQSSSDYHELQNIFQQQSTFIY
ncbi:hypothetical protein DFA_05547 [Cavenderia fasciculata]|uniref:Uncharacterized protein n=1 Tax=Cavenderia fasciculata TaxID=261658 RepID=F4PLJ3_CACFS|nr:uncharacterized protein DFA_05547 [Cavenderia fasciculata]EGG23415.1 hypothetical protein DFA_05547 [Cavenderia fasciculata]|eukprot:XP_004361266.1 hypothetical protein DFA_05547 [Cavenderia fasciculata]